MEDWAEVRRLHRSEGLGIKAIARRSGLARNTVRAALAADTPARYVRAPGGSRVVIAQRVGWTFSASVLRARVAVLRPLYAPADPADRTTYKAGEIVQCDLWFPGRVVPVAENVLADPPDRYTASLVTAARAASLT